MRKRKKGAAALCLAAVLLCLAATAVYTAAFIWSDDTRPPVISMSSDTLEVSVRATDAELLAGVTAMDARDGDVTGDILIQGVSDLSDGVAEVTYAAFDAAGNVSKAVRTLRYTDYEPPRITLSETLVFNANTSMDVLGRVVATDVIDGDISHLVKAELVSNTGSLSYPGVHEMELRATNSLGDTARLTLPVDVLSLGTYNATAVLKEYLIYLPQGSSFDARNYLEGLTLGINGALQRELSSMDVDIDSDVDPDVPGVYSVRYTVSYTRGTVEYVGYTRLHVVVEG